MTEMLQPLGGNLIPSGPFRSTDYELYTSTLSKYKDVFDEDAPEAVWENTGSWFDKGTYMQVNLYRQVALQWKAEDDDSYLEGNTSGRRGDKAK